MALQDTALAVRGWSIEGFRAFWAKPDLSHIDRIGDIAAPGIVGHWPRPIGDVTGWDRYRDVLAAVATVCPDLSLTAPDYAQAGDLHFVRWEASGTGQDGRPMRFHGVDRLKLSPDGVVLENYVVSDAPFFADVADYLRRHAS